MEKLEQSTRSINLNLKYFRKLFFILDFFEMQKIFNLKRDNEIQAVFYFTNRYVLPRGMYYQEVCISVTRFSTMYLYYHFLHDAHFLHDI
jgi:hypothetical protein